METKRSVIFLPPSTVYLLTSLLLITGCSASYTGERLFWVAERQRVALAKDAGHATAEQFAEARRAFERVIAHTPETVWAPRAHLAIGGLYAAQRDYAKARTTYALVVQNYHRYKILVLQARVLIANTYQAEQQWDEAANVYRELTEYAPWTTAGLEAPLYIAALYRTHQHPQQAQKAYERAVRVYTKLIPEAPTEELAHQIKQRLALAHQQLGESAQAVTLLEELEQAPAGTNRPLVLLMLGSIYQTRLQAPEKAREAYTKLVNEFPQHPLVKLATTQLERLKPPAPAPVP